MQAGQGLHAAGKRLLWAKAMRSSIPADLSQSFPPRTIVTRWATRPPILTECFSLGSGADAVFLCSLSSTHVNASSPRSK